MSNVNRRRSAIVGVLALLVAAAGFGFGSSPADAQSCYPPTPGCGTTTTIAPSTTTTIVGSTTTTVARTTTTVARTTTTTCVPNGNGNGNGGCNGNGKGPSCGQPNGTGGNANGPSGGDGNGTSRCMAVDDTTVTPGQPLRVTALRGSFAPGSTGIITIRSVERQIGTFTAQADGSVSELVKIPDDMEAGTHTIFLKGSGADGQPLTLSRTVTLSTAAGGSTVARGRFGLLARTGTLIAIPATMLGLVLITVGLVLRRNGQRRRLTAEH